MFEKIAFQINIPMRVALAYADGLKVEGRFGDQIMYTLTDERVMYVPPVVRNKLIELGIQPGELFSICKAERKEGNRPFIEWQVKKDDPSNDRPAWEMPPANGNSIVHTNGRAKPVPSNGHAGSYLQTALTSSIDAAIAAEQYAASKGFSVRFGSEDLRAMALSLFIQHARKVVCGDRRLPSIKNPRQESIRSTIEHIRAPCPNRGPGPRHRDQTFAAS